MQYATMEEAMETQQLNLDQNWTFYDGLLATCLHHAYNDTGNTAFGRQTLYQEWQAGTITELEAVVIAAECGWFWVNIKGEHDE